MAPMFHLLLHVLLSIFSSTFAQNKLKIDSPSTAFAYRRWVNTRPPSGNELTYSDGTLVRPILHQTPAFDDNATATRLTFACAFICSGTCDGFLFAIVIIKNHSVQPHSIHPSSEHVQVVWSANRDRPVKDGAVLTLSSNAGLVLTDADGSVAWSSALRGDGTVIGMLLNPQGCLVIFDHFQLGLWGSFHYPTDTLLPWQRLVPEQRLIANASPSNWSRGQLYLSFDSQGISAYVQSDPPTRYYLRGPSAMVLGPSEEQPIYQPTYMQYIHGSLELIYHPGINSSIPLRFSNAEQFVRLDSDGHFRAYEYNPNLGWIAVEDLLFDELNNCDYPTVCGRYGICTNGRCSCPQGGDDEPTYFAPVDGDPRLGCAATTPLTCQDSQRRHLMALGRVSYFGFPDTKLSGVEIEACKSACSSNCSCKAAILRYESNASSGSCLLLDEVFSLRTPAEKDTYNYTAFLKVQLPVPSKKVGGLLPRRLARLTIVSLGSVAAIVFIILVIIIGVRVRIWLSRGKPQEKMDVVAADADSIEESHGQFEHVLDLELPTRFSYENLITATSNFSMQLGTGGSGSVFQGTLADGKRVAVKRIERILQGKKQFLAEVETISCIHHVNLVRLIGFCIERSYYLLVYEYMSNGSLDRWIFHEDKDLTLDWKTRHGIILGVAKGLAYLHEECRQRILHLDIKPQNILLDENFTAKIADFGLAKLVNKDQSKVMTVMRGTMGYMAPEWLNSVITEKADVYSFGVVVMEIVCGRKNLDYGQPMEDIYLVKALKEKAQERRLEDLINEEDEDMHLHVDEAVKMLRIAMWCLQLDLNLRPAMSRVVKALEDGVDLDPAIDYQFIVPSTLSLTDKVSNPIFNSILSGPR